MSAWSTVLGLFADGTLNAAKVETLIGASIAAYRDVATSGDASVGAVLRSIEKAAPEALPIIEQVANILMPGTGDAIEVAAYVLAYSHKMTPAEEEAWMARASQSSG